jgi:catechol 2,3-dioxygenase-like lactoylglutathione lyase family enzyme
MITGVQDVYYYVQDIARALGFYRDVLGLKVTENDPHFTALDAGGLRLGLHWTGGEPVARIPRDGHGAMAGATLTLKTGNIQALKSHLETKGVAILGFMDEPWGKLLSIEDPDGNVLKIMQPPVA